MGIRKCLELIIKESHITLCNAFRKEVYSLNCVLREKKAWKLMSWTSILSCKNTINKVEEKTSNDEADVNDI